MRASSEDYLSSMKMVFGQNITVMTFAYHMPELGKAGPQSQLKEACILRMWLAWHSPLKAGSTHLGGTM